jgi:hypothetical protein
MKFDEGSGIVAHDESFNNYDGILDGDGLGNDLPSWATGKQNGALLYDGTDDYITAQPKVSSGEITLSFSMDDLGSQDWATYISLLTSTMQYYTNSIGVYILSVWRAYCNCSLCPNRRS